MRRIGLILLGVASAALASACGSAEAAPAPAPGARNAMQSGRRTQAARPMAGVRSSRRPHRPPHRRPLVYACQRPTHVSATAGGRYAGLILRLHVPADCATYGSYQDYGHYGATSYAGHANIPAGYWVYHYPYWYVYQQQVPAASVPAPVPGGAYCRAPASTSANANGKYRVLVRRLHVPGDCAAYGSFQDYGHYGATSYAGHANLPAGYWVYRYPYWYLWQRLKP